MNLEQVINDDICILMSLREEYFNLILKGEKKFEYRKIYRKTKTKSFIYISKTKKSIVGILDFDTPIIDTPENIAKMASDIKDSNYCDMYEYLKARKMSYAMKINKIYLFDREITALEIKKAGLKFTAPQSYSILDNDNKILKYIRELPVTIREFKL